MTRGLRSAFVVGAFLIAVAQAPSEANAVTFTETLLNAPTGWDASYGFAINNSGQVAGSSYNTYGGVEQATIWNGTTPTLLNAITFPANGAISRALAINNSGQVAGFSENNISTFPQQATVLNGTTPTLLNTPVGFTYSDAYAINNSGEVAGYSTAVSSSVVASPRQQGLAWQLG